jgi:hypothetical protein
MLQEELKHLSAAPYSRGRLPQLLLLSLSHTTQQSFTPGLEE